MVMARALPKNKESNAVYVEIVTPATAKLCSDASEALEEVMAKDRSKGEKAIVLLALLQVRRRQGELVVVEAGGMVAEPPQTDHAVGGLLLPTQSIWNRHSLKIIVKIILILLYNHDNNHTYCCCLYHFLLGPQIRAPQCPRLVTAQPGSDQSPSSTGTTTTTTTV